MTVLENSIRIDAPPDRVWAVLSSLNALDQYDPGVIKAEVVSAVVSGVGSERRCNLAAGGWFKERVAAFQPNEALTFELFECSLPVKRLRHSYRLTADGAGTHVQQRMEYELKYGLLGRVMDAVMVRKKWDQGIKGFFSGLKHYVETGSRPPAKR